MTDQEIEKLALQYEAFGFGRTDGGFTTHGFDPDGLVAFAAALMSAEREACAALLDAEHEKRKIWDNLAAFYARMIRERLNSVG